MSAHARHNEEVCNYLHTHGSFNDWVVTTAFYAALHYVQHALFPLTEGDKEYKTFNLYFAQVSQFRQTNKHRETQQLVQKVLPNVASRYRWLMNSCHSARYNSYQVTREEATTARKYLADIKKEVE